MPYTQLTPKYEALQWTTGMATSAISSILDPNGTLAWTINSDGSLHFENAPFEVGDIPLDGWIVSAPYWSTAHVWNFPAVVTSAPGGFAFSDAEFNEQFTLAS